MLRTSTDDDYKVVGQNKWLEWAGKEVSASMAAGPLIRLGDRGIDVDCNGMRYAAISRTVGSGE